MKFPASFFEKLGKEHDTGGRRRAAAAGGIMTRTEEDRFHDGAEPRVAWWLRLCDGGGCGKGGGGAGCGKNGGCLRLL